MLIPSAQSAGSKWMAVAQRGGGGEGDDMACVHGPTPVGEYLDLPAQ